jgi:hypothetical protein
MIYSVFPRTEVLKLTTFCISVVSQHGVAEVDSTLREVVLALESKIQALEKENKHLSKCQISIAVISIISWHLISLMQFSLKSYSILTSLEILLSSFCDCALKITSSFSLRLCFFLCESIGLRDDTTTLCHSRLYPPSKEL